MAFPYSPGMGGLGTVGRAPPRTVAPTPVRPPRNGITYVNQGRCPAGSAPQEGWPVWVVARAGSVGGLVGGGAPLGNRNHCVKMPARMKRCKTHCKNDLALESVSLKILLKIMTPPQMKSQHSFSFGTSKSCWGIVLWVAYPISACMPEIVCSDMFERIWGPQR